MFKCTYFFRKLLNTVLYSKTLSHGSAAARKPSTILKEINLLQVLKQLEVYTWHKYDNHFFFKYQSFQTGYYMRLNRGCWALLWADDWFAFNVPSLDPCQNTNVSFVLNIYNGKAMNFTFHLIKIQTKRYLYWIGLLVLLSYSVFHSITDDRLMDQIKIS